MDLYVSAPCGSSLNFSYASSAVAQYRSWAQQYALADRYFQPLSGATSSNDMYFATARFMFVDNAYAAGDRTWLRAQPEHHPVHGHHRL